MWVERDRKHMRVCHAKTGEHSVDEGALRQGDRSGRAIAQNFESEEPTSLAEVRDLEATSELVLEREHGVCAFRDDETVVDVDDDDTAARTTKAAGKAKVDKGKGRARPLVRLGSPIDIDDDDEPVRPKKKVSTKMCAFYIC